MATERPHRFLFVVDPLSTLDPGHDSSVALMEAAGERGHVVAATTMSELSLAAGAVRTRCRELTLRRGNPSPGQDWFDAGLARDRAVEDFDAVFVRTDPPVDPDYLRATYVLDLVDPRRVFLINAPGGLRAANEKLFALQFPELCPPTTVTASRNNIRNFLQAHGAAVIKPTDGMGGRGVLLLREGDENVESILEEATDRDRRHVIVQKYLDEVRGVGDRRVIVLDGVPVGAVRRRAPAGEFRCNMAVGGAPEADMITARDREICARLASRLNQLGLIFVGIDVIGSYLIEVNVTSPTGLREIDGHSTGPGLGIRIIKWLEQAIAGRAVEQSHELTPLSTQAKGR